MQTSDHRTARAALRAALLLAALLGWGANVAQTPPPAAAETVVAAPRIEVAEREVDLGTVVRGETREARFALHNTGDATLRILRAKPG
jgi:hypothetical protein